MTDQQQHPITPPTRLADTALDALGGRLDESDFRTDFRVIGGTINGRQWKFIEPPKEQLEDSND